MIKDLKEPSQKHILRIAKKHFLSLGFSGARMQAIADEAGVNKALLHYYYKNKEGLFKKVFDDEAREMITSAQHITTQHIGVLEKIRLLIENDITHLLKNPGMPMFMMREMARDPKLIEKFDPDKQGAQIMHTIAIEILAAQKKGIIKKNISVQDIFTNMGAMAMFPFLGRELCMHGAQMSEKEYNVWVNERKKTVPDFIISAIQTG